MLEMRVSFENIESVPLYQFAFTKGIDIDLEGLSYIIIYIKHIIMHSAHIKYDLFITTFFELQITS